MTAPGKRANKVRRPASMGRLEGSATVQPEAGLWGEPAEPAPRYGRSEICNKNDPA
jgi:hypothetical protein